MKRLLLLCLVLVASALALAHAATYNVTGVNTTVVLGGNSSAYISEVLSLQLSNVSVSQYTIERSSLNLTLNDWQSLVGPELEPHIINPRSGIYSFNLLPGPITYVALVPTANMYMDYYVANVVTISQTGPRTFLYKFNPGVLNFQEGSSGVVLPKGSRLNIIMPNSSTLVSVYPLPDSTHTLQSGINSTQELSWYRSEPLYDFSLVFQFKTGLSTEVIDFFGSIYSALGVFVYVLLGLAVLLFIIYTYLKVGREKQESAPPKGRRRSR